MFITIEGIEGSGKSTLAAALAKKLASRGMDVVVTAEPGGDPVGKRIRRLVLDAATEISERAELLIFEAARAQHVDVLIRPALERGAIVVCDRFADSSIAYQGYARKMDIALIKRLNEHATGGLKPDLTILLDMPAEEGLARQVKIDRFSKERLAFHEAVRRGFLEIAEADPERFFVVDATAGAREVAARALEEVDRRVAERGTGK